MFGRKQNQPQQAPDLAGAITRLVDARVEQRIAAMVANWEALDAQEDAEEGEANGAIPTVVHDLKGQPVTLSREVRAKLDALIRAGGAYIYQAGIDQLFYNVWLTWEVDPESPTGAKGVRVPLADWARQQETRA